VGADVLCCDGQCHNDPCAASITCGAAEVCDGCAGACREDTCARIRCPDGYTCARGQCEPETARPGLVTDLAASGAGGCACALGAPPGRDPAGLVLLALIAVATRRRRDAPRRAAAG
jgi:MYXO-CTERM domain-containing protein